jgi:HK97 family phage prohead protease
MEQRIRAYSVLDIKASDDNGGRRVFTGVATTPSTDRVGDIVEPKGAEFELPIPLLWQHNSREPIGWVTDAKVSDNGIEIVGEVANVMTPGKLKDRLDEAWQMLIAKLVRGLSIGFQGIESNRIENTYSYRFVRWAWYELSAVTIPANMDCSITAIKSFDLAARRRAAPGAHPIVRLDTAPAATGTNGPGASGQQTRRKDVVYLK